MIQRQALLEENSCTGNPKRLKMTVSGLIHKISPFEYRNEAQKHAL